jgi:hypothetical protein
MKLIFEYKFPSGNLIIPLFLLNNELEQIVILYFVYHYCHINIKLKCGLRSGQKIGMATKIK